MAFLSANPAISLTAEFQEGKRGAPRPPVLKLSVICIGTMLGKYETTKKNNKDPVTPRNQKRTKAYH